MRGTRRYALFGLLLLATCTSAVVVANWKAISIQYHLRLLKMAQKGIAEVGPRSEHQEEFIHQFDRHLDALVRLGHLVRREFLLENVEVPSLQSNRLWKELMAISPKPVNAIMRGYEPSTPDAIIVWDMPENIVKWESIILAHEAPADPVLSRSATNGGSYDYLVGTWADGKGEDRYTISRHPDGLLFVPHSSKVSEVILKNLRGQAGVVSFDQYYYLEPSEELVSVNNKTGDHPFSGVRCQVEFAPLDDPNALRVRTKTILTQEPVEETLRRKPQSSGT